MSYLLCKAAILPTKPYISDLRVNSGLELGLGLTWYYTAELIYSIYGSLVQMWFYTKLENSNKSNQSNHKFCIDKISFYFGYDFAQAHWPPAIHKSAAMFQSAKRWPSYIHSHCFSTVDTAHYSLKILGK